jgi:hypothetical protein
MTPTTPAQISRTPNTMLPISTVHSMRANEKQQRRRLYVARIKRCNYMKGKKNLQ